MKNIKIKDIILIALFVAISVVSRVGAVIPSIQITTTLIIIITLNYGLKYGLSLALLTPLVSNMILGQGIWTLWQMFAWGVVALITTTLRKYKEKLYIISTFSFLMGYLYGLIVNTLSIFTYGLFGGTVIAYFLASLPYDTIHALSNFTFTIVLLLPISFVIESNKDKY